MKTKTILLIIAILCKSLTIWAQEIIKMEKSNGVFLMPCTVNGLSLKFYFDTGAANVSISLTEAIFMLKNGYLLGDDIIGTEYYQFANGNIEEGTKIIIKEIKIGKLVLYNIEASVNHNLDAPLLLGQSALSQLGKIQIDYKENTLTIINDSDPNILVGDNIINPEAKSEPSELTASYAGISFKFPSKWTIEKTEIEKDLSYQINCENPDPESSEIYSVIILKTLKDTKKMVKLSIKELKKDQIFRKAFIGDYNMINYNGYNAVITNYNVTLQNEKIYGMLICFNTEDNTIFILKQSDSISKLINNFKLIENSLIIK